MANILNKLFDFNKKEVKRLEKIADKVEVLADQYESMSDDALKAKTEEFKNRYQKGETVSDLLPEAFATTDSTD